MTQEWYNLFKQEFREEDEFMPWDVNDYPVSLKNFDPLLRKKTIEIANALLANGYEDDRAIPIAISQAKEWMKDASKAEKETFDKERNPKKTDQHDSSSANPKLLDNAVEVFYEEDHWVVKTKEAKRASDTFDKKAEAVDRANEIAANKGSEVIIYKKDGSRQN